VLTHFDRNGFGYTLNRATGELLVAEKFDPTVNWASRVDTNPAAPDYGRPLVVSKYYARRGR
jgi:glucose dehydrogenase